jgi:hypothetical protein
MSEKVCLNCEAPVKEGQYCAKGNEILCLNCVLKTMAAKEVKVDPLALDMKCSARQLSILLLGHAQEIAMKAYDSQAIKPDAGSRLAVLNEIDRIVELVRKLDIVADKIIARGE